MQLLLPVCIILAKPTTMKHIFYILFFVFALQACNKHNYLERKDSYKALTDAVKRLEKSPEDERALEALPVLYKNIKQDRLNLIYSFEKQNNLNRYDKILDQYNDLQQLYNAIMGNTAAFRLISPVDYSTQIMETKDAAAQAYYDLGNQALIQGGRKNSADAYKNFQKADKYVSNYKNARAKMDTAYSNAIIDVVINQVQDNFYFYNSGFGSFGINYTNEYFQQALVRDLSGEGDRYAARFFTDWEARRNTSQPDVMVDIVVRNMDIPYPQTTQYQRNLSRNVVIGTDTAGRAITRLATATLYVTRQYFNAYGTIDVRIRDRQSNRSSGSRSFSETIRWNEEMATYTGDPQALDATDLTMVNNSRFRNNMRREDVLSELYRRIYPNVRNYLSQQFRW